jgi:hypothetical protein
MSKRKASTSIAAMATASKSSRSSLTSSSSSAPRNLIVEFRTTAKRALTSFTISRDADPDNGERVVDRAIDFITRWFDYEPNELNMADDPTRTIRERLAWFVVHDCNPQAAPSGIFHLRSDAVTMWSKRAGWDSTAGTVRESMPEVIPVLLHMIQRMPKQFGPCRHEVWWIQTILHFNDEWSDIDLLTILQNLDATISIQWWTMCESPQRSLFSVILDCINDQSESMDITFPLTIQWIAEHAGSSWNYSARNIEQHFRGTPSAPWSRALIERIASQVPHFRPRASTRSALKPLLAPRDVHALFKLLSDWGVSTWYAPCRAAARTLVEAHLNLFIGQTEDGESIDDLLGRVMGRQDGVKALVQEYCLNDPYIDWVTSELTSMKHYGVATPPPLSSFWM